MYEKLICGKCQTGLVMKKVNFSYLAHNFATEIPACPKCGQVFISEQLAKGKMAEVEKNLEEK